MSFPRDHCGSSADVRSLMFGTARPATVTVVAADSTSPCNPGPCQIHPPDTRALISQCCAMPSNPLSPSNGKTAFAAAVRKLTGEAPSDCGGACDSSNRSIGPAIALAQRRTQFGRT